MKKIFGSILLGVGVGLMAGGVAVLCSNGGAK